MNGPDGRWVEVALPGGGVRRDWRPDAQPASPDGGPGEWHVVTPPGRPSCWLWVPAGQAAPRDLHADGTWVARTQALARTAAGQLGAPVDKRPFPRRKALAIAGLAATTVAAGVTGARFLGPNDPAQVVAGTDTRRPAAPEPARPDEGRGVASAAELEKDVATTIGRFRPAADGGGEGGGSLQVVFTNNGTRMRHFRATIQAVDPATGEAIAADTIRVVELMPGQSLSVTAFAAVPAGDPDVLAAATFRVAAYEGIRRFHF